MTKFGSSEGRRSRGGRWRLMGAVGAVLVTTSIGVGGACDRTALAATVEGRAASNARPGTAVIDLVDRPTQGPARTVRFRLAVTDDGRPSRGSSDDGRATTNVVVRRRDAGGELPVVELEVERHVRPPSRNEPSRHSRVDVSGRVRPGKAVLLGTVPQPAGGSLDIVVTLQ